MFPVNILLMLKFPFVYCILFHICFRAYLKKDENKNNSICSIWSWYMHHIIWQFPNPFKFEKLKKEVHYIYFQKTFQRWQFASWQSVTLENMIIRLVRILHNYHINDLAHYHSLIQTYSIISASQNNKNKKQKKKRKKTYEKRCQQCL